MVVKILRNRRYKIYLQKWIRKVFFQHDMAYGDFIDYARRTSSDNVFRDKTFNIAKNPKYDGYQRGLASMVYKSFDQKSAWLAYKSAKGGINILQND